MAALTPLAFVPGLRAAAARTWARRDPRLEVRALGLTFPSPVGLAGGFDKNAAVPNAFASLGFGFAEFGTVTARAQEANPSPNLFRLPKDRALVNRLGFPNLGAARVADRLAASFDGRTIPWGVSIGKSRSVSLDPIEGVIDDYTASLEAVLPVADFVVVNVSSPNTKDLRAIQGADLARRLLGTLQEVSARAATPKPLLVKIAPDLTDEELDALLRVVASLGVPGVVATNTTVARTGLTTDAYAVRCIGAGGLSGPPLKARALRVVAQCRAALGPEALVVGVGGIENDSDVVEFLAAGADLVQLYTGFVYGGPATVATVHRGLSARLDRERASSLRALTSARV